MTSTAPTARDVDPAALRALAARLDGDLLIPGDPRYDERRCIWNGMIDRRPALIARVTSAEEARRVLAFARERGLPVSIRGGGHNVSGSALVDGGVTIDNSLRRGARVDLEQKRVEVEPGALLGELDAATAPYGLAVPAGIQTTTGVAGLTLGGGIGWLMRAHGLTCDHLVAADLVTADGELVLVDEERHPDLLWALRGGGGNFGIVTRFVFGAVEQTPQVIAGIVLFPLEEGVEVLRRYREWAAELPRTVTTIVSLRTILPLPVFPAALHGRRVVGIAVCQSDVTDPGPPEAIRGFGEPLFDGIAVRPFIAHQAMFDASVPAGHRYYWKSGFLRELTDEAIETLVEHNLRAPQPWSYTLVFQMGGAVADVPNDATAFNERRAPFNVNINGVGVGPESDAGMIEWARDAFAAIDRYLTGGVYVNFLGEEGEARVRAAYGGGYDRLATIKARYDPDNVFRANQNIRPAS